MAKATFVLVASFIRAFRTVRGRLGAFCLTPSNIHKMDFYFLQIIRQKKRKKIQFHWKLVCELFMHTLWRPQLTPSFETGFCDLFPFLFLGAYIYWIVIVIFVLQSKCLRQKIESRLSFASVISSGFSVTSSAFEMKRIKFPMAKIRRIIFGSINSICGLSLGGEWIVYSNR